MIGLLVTQLINLVAQTDKTSNTAEQNKLPKFNDSHYSKINKDSIIRENTLNNADLVFEGRLIYYSSQQDSIKGNNGIAYYIAEVKRVFKGNINFKTVRVLFNRWSGDLDSHGFIKDDDTIAIFFCKKNSKLKDKLPKDTVDKNDILILDGYNANYCSNLNLIILNEHPGGIGMDFGTKKENVYNYLRTRKGLNVPPYVEPPRKLPPPYTYKITRAKYDSIRASKIKVKNYNNNQ